MRSCALSLFALTVYVFVGRLMGNPGRPPLIDPNKARELFGLAAKNGQPLTLAEIELFFRAFDANGDARTEREEFIQEWQKLGLGDDLTAGLLFDHVDVDGDGSLSSSPDLSRIYTFFDLNSDGLISEPEFVIAWGTLSG